MLVAVGFCDFFLSNLDLVIDDRTSPLVNQGRRLIYFFGVLLFLRGNALS